ncbi:MAG: DUF3659 domain-containing protein [Cytophagaceae bacterium]
MQTIKLITMALLMTFISTAIKAQSYKAQNISSAGQITDSTGKLVGKIENGTVFDSKGQKLGFVDANGVVTDSKGTKLGRAAKNGDFYDLKENIVLRVNEKGEIKDSKGHYLGKVHPSHAQLACALHCFFCHDCK